MDKKNKVIVFILLMSFASVIGQTIKGKVTDESGAPLPFVNVLEKETVNGVSTDDKGEFTLNVKKIPVTLVFSSVGFSTLEKTVYKASYVTVVLRDDNVLDEVVLTGNRSKPRTILDSAVPIDNVSVRELQATGQTNIDQMLTYTVPSYNSSNQTISDATAHFDPADLRGLGPSRTLVLVNGKRKNQSALVYVNDTPGKGEVGVDMKSIPTAAIERVEILRDGASAQYGSDAVAGVVNIILKKNIDFTQVNVNSGVTKEGDGFNIDGDVNHTFTFGEGGFVNTTLGLSYQEKTNRAGRPGTDVLFGETWAGIFKDEFDDGNITQAELDAGLVFAESLSNGSYPWIQENPDLGMTVGQPEMKKGDLFVNAEYPLNDNTKLYAFGGFNMRQGKSFALYRTPYWPGLSFDGSNNPLYSGGEYQGFQPTFETDIQDILFTAGGKFKLGEFDADLSGSFGRNSVDYTIGNTINGSLGSNSPTSFDAGAYAFSNIIGNFDVSRSFGDVSIGLGVEGRQERFEVTAGEEASYIDGGAQSFPGLQPSNALNETRTNIGGYGTLDWDVSEDFLIGGALRYENYSDFGDNFSWKVSSRYKVGEAGVLRASYSTGFRAPSLHQVYLSNVQTLVSGGTISNQGTFNNVSPVIKDLGVASLFAETSKNISAGLTVKASNDFTISLDYYNVKVEDRVVFSGEIGGTDDNGNPNAIVQQILDDNSVTSIKFFINAADTKTEGFDYTMRYKNIDFAAGKLGLNLALNINRTKLEGEVKTPTKLANYKNAIFNRKEQSRIISARPNTKLLFGADYKYKKFTAFLNNTYFGEVTWQHATDPNKDQTFSGKVITDVSFGYEFSDMISFNAQVNNLFDVYPDEIDTKGDFVTDLGGRFKYPWEVNQFGFNGMTFKAGLTFKF
ncbi:TonB-dependent receptor [Tenacibaculum discolor]|uniref:TonB-dependent receptor n=1 Tax=Tenacibaculum discolor TaxID=361581 RepID=A0A2G1BW44_9FLAO|nr:TonB-dependent receptor [Tenacibaculum discolor]MDP2540321.1 TonB-dependent receptor [Tenacibaculum discolor]PHN98263.1 TonB-dependent receptor [Tenacibaculum discolor]PHN99943.1 TonB-dependent receptor [Rhodobacteraceae bacterium 4F10]